MPGAGALKRTSVSTRPILLSVTTMVGIETLQQRPSDIILLGTGKSTFCRIMSTILENRADQQESLWQVLR